jgi:CAAX prenyl protease-like protein
MNTKRLNSPTFTRVAPFVAFMGFIAIEEGLRFLLSHQVISFDPTLLYWLYIPKAALTGLILLLFRRSYLEISVKDLRSYRNCLLSVGSGLLVFLLWINMDWTLGSQFTPAGFNPDLFRDEHVKWLMIAVRVSGAVIIVPIMEELFWRSFLLRYLIRSDFTTVAIGRFSLFSFIAVSILFGLEHYYVFAGIMAGVVFNSIYYYTRSIAHCILSHAIANLCLAYYVLTTGYWHFW